MSSRRGRSFHADLAEDTSAAEDTGALLSLFLLLLAPPNLFAVSELDGDFAGIVAFLAAAWILYGGRNDASLWLWVVEEAEEREERSGIIHRIYYKAP